MPGYLFHHYLLVYFLSPLHLQNQLKKEPRNSRTPYQIFMSAILYLLSHPAVSVYDSLRLNIAGINRAAFELAQKGFEKLREQGVILNDSIISIIDFSLPSTDKRLYVVDLKNYQVLYSTYVAHGKNSGKEMANSFSNSPSSNKSSLGFYKTLDTYNGKHGYSLKLEGLEKGINDNAYERAIVFHGAKYVDPNYISRLGYIGRSQGCPAVSPREATPIINTIKEGSCLFIYSPNASYQHHSSILS
jgi:hypothetical protein